MANGIVQVPPDSTGKKVDASSLDIGVDSVLRQRIVISDNLGVSGFATVVNGALNVAFIDPPAVNVSGSVMLAAGTTVGIAAGTAVIGDINAISRSVNVVLANLPSLAAGTANIGYLNNISATVAVIIAGGLANIGGVSLVAGTSNIGFINSISKTVDVAIANTLNIAVATPFTVNNISATVVSGLSYVVEKTTNSQVQVGDSANAAIRVNIVAGAVGGSGGTSQTDGSSFDTQTTLFNAVGGIFDDAASGTLSENDAGVVRMTTNRAFHTNMRTDGGVKMDDSTNAALRVNVVAGSASGPSNIDNTTYSTGVTTVAPAGFIFFSASATTVTDGRVAAARITDSRAVHINLRNNAGTEIGTNTTPLSVKIENQSATVNVSLAGGTINNISATVNTVIGAGTANIGFINGISATISVINAAGTANMGAVSLAAGTANIGFINGISATVNVAFAGGISLAAGTANIGFINNISATVNVAVMSFKDASGNAIQIVDSANIALRVAGYGALGSLPIGGFIDASGQNRNLVDSSNLALRVTLANATATVTVTTANPWVVNLPSASHGPITAVRSTSATATLIAAPGAGLHIYVTGVNVANAGTVVTTAQVGVSASLDQVLLVCAANGGNSTFYFDPPWKVQSNEAVLCRVNPAPGGNCFLTVNFFVST